MVQTLCFNLDLCTYLQKFLLIRINVSHCGWKICMLLGNQQLFFAPEKWVIFMIFYFYLF